MDKDNTTIIEGAGSRKEIDARIETIRNQIEKTTSDYDREKLQERLAKLTGGVAVIHAGAATETRDEGTQGPHRGRRARHPRRQRGRHRARRRRGVPARPRRRSRRSATRPRATRRSAWTSSAGALRAPTRQIVENTGEDGDVVVAEILEKGGNIGYDAATGEFVDMIAAGIIDPAKVSPHGPAERRLAWPGCC